LEEALSFAAEGRVKAIIETQPLESINDVFQRLKTGKVNGRVVLTVGAQASREAFRKSA
jgi:propanol-preferring alcohol dehydrogenase